MASTPAFVGRARECQALDCMLDGARRGESAALVIRGEAGIGKTALLLSTKLGIASRRDLQGALPRLDH